MRLKAGYDGMQDAIEGKMLLKRRCEREEDAIEGKMLLKGRCKDEIEEKKYAWIEDAAEENITTKRK